MKKFSLYIFQAVFCMVLFISCDKAAEENTAGYSTFYLSMPTFSSAAGEKTHWDSQGLWWDTEGEIVKINGIQHQILYDNGRWMTTSTVDTTFEVNNSYYICYMGKSTQDAGWDPNNKVYTNVDLTGIVPLVGEGKTNFITLKPCCAVLKIKNITYPISSILFYQEDGTTICNNVFPKSGVDVDVVNERIVAKNNTDYYLPTDFSALADTTAYFVLPMTLDNITFGKIEINYTKNGRTMKKTTRGSVTINKGYVYTISF